MTIFVFLALPAWPQQQMDLPDRSIEDLMNMQVTSVSKTEERVSQSAAAVFVITQEDIAHSNATNIPDLLRMVPGMDVAQINANTWAVSVRGFDGRFSNKLLVMVDGRTVYTPTFGGVFWDALDLPLEDIERIEVIRGPGGSIWGANAVDGVVNVITKKASETHGGLVVAGAGNVDQGFGAIQYGGTIGNSTDYRVYMKYLDQDHLPGLAGQNGGDGWHMLRGGFRSDSALTPRDTLMLQGDLYLGREGTPTIGIPYITAPEPVNTELLVNLSGGFLQSVWNHSFSAHSDTTLEVSYDRYKRDDALHEGRETLGIEFQHHFSGWARQNIVWGVTYRDSDSESQGDLFVSLVPAMLSTQLFGAFVQDEITVAPNRVFLTIGSKVEHNYYTGFDIMPSARVAWVPTPRQTLWAAISSADRNPSSLDASIHADLGSTPGPRGIPVVLNLLGNPRVMDERLVAYEMGYRTMITTQLSIDFTAYSNGYDHLETEEPAAISFENTPPPPHFALPLVYQNLMYGETDGIEIATNWKVASHWTLSPGFAFEEVHMHLRPTSQDTTSVNAAEGSSPDESGQLRSHFTLRNGLSWDTSAYFVGRLTDPRVPSYTGVNTGLSWKFREGAELRLVGQNLLRDVHEEFVDSTESARTTLVKRSAYAQLIWHF